MRISTRPSSESQTDNTKTTKNTFFFRQIDFFLGSENDSAGERNQLFNSLGIYLSLEDFHSIDVHAKR